MKIILYGILVYAMLLFVGILAHAYEPPKRDKLTKCFVYLPDMRSERLKRWCLKQSEKMP